MVTTKLLLIAFLMLSAAPARAEPIRIAYSGVSASGTPVWLAKEEGIFARHGLEADLVAVRSAPIQVSALVSNEVQFVRGSAPMTFKGRYERNASTIAFHWDDWPTTESWYATGTLDGDRLTVNYSPEMSMSDFADGTYTRVREAK